MVYRSILSRIERDEEKWPVPFADCQRDRSCGHGESFGEEKSIYRSLWFIVRSSTVLSRNWDKIWVLDTSRERARSRTRSSWSFMCLPNEKILDKIHIFAENVGNTYIRIITDLYASQNAAFRNISVRHLAFFLAMASFATFLRDIFRSISRAYTGKRAAPVFSQSRSFRFAFQWKLSVLLSRVLRYDGRAFSGCRLWKWIKCIRRARKITRRARSTTSAISLVCGVSGARELLRCRIIPKNISSIR